MPSRIFLSVVAILCLPLLGRALEPAELIVVANNAMPESVEVARHYLAQRQVPKSNLIVLDLPKVEDISRADYDAKLAQPLRDRLKGRKDDVKAILLVYGVPLRVGSRALSATEKAELARVTEEVTAARKRLTELTEAEPQDKEATDKANAELTRLNNRRKALSKSDTVASVDSELMLLWWPEYPLERWVINPFHWQISEERRKSAPPTVMTARIDGPTPAIAKGLVDQAIKVEAEGLQGIAYFDARGIKFDPEKKGETGTGYEGYDESFREIAKLLEEAGMEVVLDDKQALFEPGSCKNAALYAGWYSHAKFIDSCEFVPGAVAWHLASSEARTLRDPKSTVWCPNLLKKGVAATIGPVAEPYTIGFPKPAEFFTLLATGKYTLIECYAKTVYFASWMGVLVGDPLYKPFAKNPLLKEEQLRSSPVGVPPVYR